MKIYAATQKGLQKKENEDRVVINHTILSFGKFYGELEQGILAVADGVGGNLAGAVASHYVANALGEYQSVDASLFQKINQGLIEASNSNADWRKMATTLAGVCINESGVQLFWVGNSRVYAVQGGKYLKQLTQDDTTINFLLSTGQLSPDEVEDFPKKNEIIACFGAGDESLLNMKIEALVAPPSMFLLTSDGIHDHLSIDDIEDVIQSAHSLCEICDLLINQAVQEGSTDDLSVMIGVI